MSLADEVRGALATAPARNIRELSLGSVAHVRGTIRARDVLEAPLTGNECVYWAVQVFEKAVLGGWLPRRLVESARDFELIDGPDAVLVVVEGARFAATRLHVSEISPSSIVPTWLDDFTSAHGIVTRDVEEEDGRVRMRNKKLRLQETTLCAGDLVGVLGEVVACGVDPARGARSYRGVAQRLALASSDERPLAVGSVEDG